MKKILISLIAFVMIVINFPVGAKAAGGVYASGGGEVTVGQTFTVTVSASGATFNALQGTISLSGPASVVSCSAGGATWMSTPSVGGQFVGMVTPAVDSLRVATIKLKATAEGSGAITISGVQLANAGSTVGSGGNSASFKVKKAADLPGAVKVTSSTHPDQNSAYEATTIQLSWTKDSGVDGFSYLLDQTEGTTPAAKTTDANTSATYADKAVGTYYFHIRAHKTDGWGTTTHFKINIKEPDAKIDESLAKPSEINVEKASNFTNDVVAGTVTGVVIFGKTEANFDANITLDPTLTVPEGKKLTAKADAKGNFKLIIDFPIKSGFYKLTIQGQNVKILTPVSDLVRFEISQADGGSINLITDKDAKTPSKTSAAVKGSFLYKEYPVMTYLVISLILAFVILAIIEITKYVRRKRQRI